MASTTMSHHGLNKSTSNLLNIDIDSDRQKRRLRSAQIKFWILVFLHSLCVFAPSTFTWPICLVSLGLTLVTGQCITLSYHRNLAHRSFDLPKWLEYLFAYCGALAGQKDPIYWVRVHRHHHQYVDTERDPHSPIQGFWFSHMGWLFNGVSLQMNKNSTNVEDLKKQPFYRFLQKTYFGHILALAFVLYALGGFPLFVWGMGVRMVLSLHVTALVNSACHIWGKRKWKTNDLSKNNWLVALLTFGEGWHNNHHAFEYSARQGLEWWQFDPTWYIIWFLEAIGLATNVKLPTKAHMKKKSFPSPFNIKGIILLRYCFMGLPTPYNSPNENS